jgi:serine phosphatase RsbU (regulator of sigma subunit)
MSHTLRYANCGHLPGLILNCAGHIERLDSTCTVLGLFPEWSSPIEERRLEDGEMLVLYTDGITESFNGASEEFGEWRLIESLRRHGEFPAAEVVGCVVDDVRRFSSGEQQDDITVIVAKCKAAS